MRLAPCVIFSFLAGQPLWPRAMTAPIPVACFRTAGWYEVVAYVDCGPSRSAAAREATCVNQGIVAWPEAGVHGPLAPAL